MTNILENIAKYKWEEIKEAKKQHPLDRLMSEALDRNSPRGFRDALIRHSNSRYGLIAEFKKASPSKGVIGKNHDPVAVARSYYLGGAACFSILTDTPSFQGSLADLRDISSTYFLPCLRKDFMLDPYQVFESRAAGADCILIILAMVSDSQASELESAAKECGMDSIIEVHNKSELERAEKLSSGIIGINNRNLETFEVSLDTTINLVQHIDTKHKTVISESGISCRSDLDCLASSGVKCFLVGEHLMKSGNVEQAMKKLLQPPFPPLIDDE